MIGWLAGAAAFAGTLAGQVTGDDGQPVAGAAVQVLGLTLGATETLTGADGRFEVTGLPAGTYRVRAVAPLDLPFAEQLGGQATDLCSADTWTVSDVGRVEGADVVLPRGATFVGRLLTEDGEPLQGAVVSALLPVELVGVERREAITDADGWFVVQGVPAWGGAIQLQVEADEVPDQLLPGVYTTVGATSWLPDPAAPTDVGEHALLPGITVAGSVLGPEGVVDEGTAHVFSPSQIRTVELIDGTFEAVGLPPGDVLLWADSPGLATTYWPDGDRPGARIAVLDEGEVAADIELWLPLESRVSGMLAGADDFSGASVLLINDDSSVGVATLVEADGTFEIGGLHAGRYAVSISADAQDLASGYLREPDGSQTLFDVPAEGALDLGVVALEGGAEVHGTVRDRYTGVPVPGAVVFAEPRTSGLLESTTAGPDGSYALRALAPGTWTLQATYQHVCPQDPGWVTVFHADEVNEAFAQPLELGEGEVVQWDVGLLPDDDHDAMDDVWEVQHGLDPQVDDSHGDPDGDGYTNREEFLLGTDPSGAREAGGCGCGVAGVSMRALPTAWMLRRRRAPVAAR